MFWSSMTKCHQVKAILLLTQTPLLRLQMYLMRYGYMDGTSTSGKTANLLSPDALSDSIKEFQRFAGLPVTGDMDGNTEKFMSMPRCGVKDKERTNQDQLFFYSADQKRGQRGCVAKTAILSRNL